MSFVLVIRTKIVATATSTDSIGVARSQLSAVLRGTKLALESELPMNRS